MDDATEPQHGAPMPGMEAGRSDDDGLEQLLQRLVELARHVVPAADSVSITVAQGAEFRTSNSTGTTALAADQIQYDEGDGPCLHAMRTAEQVRADIDGARRRWPTFASRAGELGVAGVMSTPVPSPTGGPPVGALNIYAAERGVFAEPEQVTATLLGDHASILLGGLLALASATQTNEQLEQAVASREVIGMAKGILMEQQGCDRDEAFDVLRRASQRENRKLRDLAEEVVGRVEERSRRHDP